MRRRSPGSAAQNWRKPVKIYVGNLNYDASEEFVYQLFSRHGVVEGVWIMNSRVGSPHSQGFVLMPDAPEAERAIETLNGRVFEGREITVSKART